MATSRRTEKFQPADAVLLAEGLQPHPQLSQRKHRQVCSHAYSITGTSAASKLIE
jgi:hypothetical protein